MFQIEMYPDIVMHLKSNSSIFKKHSSGWYEIFCPYCNDATRKSNPQHGHFHIAPNYPFGHCFRCGTKVGLHQLLFDTGFQDAQTIEKIKKIGGFTYGGYKRLKPEKKCDRESIINNLLNDHKYFSETHPQYYKLYLEYLETRCFEVNPIQFCLKPSINEDQFGVTFLNYNGNFVTTRFINGNIRYYNSQRKTFYYFQDISTIDQKNNLVITEGGFDLINLYNYCKLINNEDSFYIAIGGSNYKSNILDIVSNYMMIGSYNIHIILDQGLMFLDRLINSTKHSLMILNPEIQIKFYMPTVSKDVSDCMLIEELK